MSWVAVAVVGGAVIGGVASNSAADKAADAQEASADKSTGVQLKALEEQKRVYDQNRADMQPWRDAGVSSLSQMSAGMAPGGDYMRDFTLADFQKDPGYAFRMKEGEQALERSAAARGGLLSGGTGKALQRYGQDYASGEYSNAYNRFNNDRTQRFNRLASVAGVGQTATRDVASMGTQYGQSGQQVAGQIGENYVGAGNARAAAAVGGANAIGGAANSIGNYFAMRQFLGGGGTGGGVTPPNPYAGTGTQGGTSGIDYTIYG